MPEPQEQPTMTATVPEKMARDFIAWADTTGEHRGQPWEPLVELLNHAPADPPSPHLVDVETGTRTCVFAKSPGPFATMSNDDPSDVIGARVREIRRDQGLTVGTVAGRCAAVGVPHLTENALYLIEGGGRGKAGTRSRRRVTVEELLTIALSLGVPPIVLLLPADEAAPFALAPKATVPTGTAYRWLIGQAAFPSEDLPDDLVQTFELIASAHQPAWMAGTPISSSLQAQVSRQIEEMQRKEAAQLEQRIEEVVRRLMDGSVHFSAELAAPGYPNRVCRFCGRTDVRAKNSDPFVYWTLNDECQPCTAARKKAADA